MILRTGGLPPLERLCVDHGAATPLFTAAGVAAAEAQRRRSDPDLCRRVAAFLGDAATPLPADRPLFMLIRAIASADNEVIRFAQLCDAVGAQPVILTMHGDRFVHFNPDKYRRTRLTFWSDRPERRLRVGDLRSADGTPMGELRTRRGGRLVDYHAGLLDAAGWRIPRFDRSEWLQPGGRSDYLQFCALAMVGAVLVEAMDTGPAEVEFWRREILPGFARAAELFGASPLLTSHFAAEEITDEFWWGYPSALLDDARRLVRGVDGAVRVGGAGQGL